MKKVKKLLALIVAMTMVLGMGLTSLAADTATITIDNAGQNALFTNVQIVEANPETETGWDIVDTYTDYFTDEDAFGNMDEQTILKGMISSATSGTAGEAIDGFDTKYAVALDAIVATLPAPAPADAEEGTAQVGSASPITVSSAGVYVIRGYEPGYAYGTMAAYISFGPYDTDTGLPTGLEGDTIEAKRVPITIDKTADDADKVVEIGRIVTYTVTTTVPYIPTTAEDPEYWFKDSVTGGEFVTTTVSDPDAGDSYYVAVNVVVPDTSYKVTIEVPVASATGVTEIKTELLEGVLAANTYANDTILISYDVRVTDTYVENSATLGDAENNPNYGTDSEKLFTGQVTMTKYAEAEEGEDPTVTLAGAGFEVRKLLNSGTYSDPLEFVMVEKGVYQPALETTPEAQVVTEVFTAGTAGTVVIQGLDLGTYQFKETTAPAGYYINEELKTATISLKENVTVAETENDIVDGTTSIVDSVLASLPSTGGIGTTIFTIGGCVIMIAAAALYFVNRRKSEEN